VIVVGAGMAGLLAAAILRNECTKIIESQSSLPNNHSAVLRFRSTAVSDALNIPFRQVDVMKAVEIWRNPIADCLAYSVKTNGSATLRSITGATGLMEKRYIAPPDFIQRLEACVSVPIDYDTPLSPDFIKHTTPWAGTPIISTIPMHSLMKLLGWENRNSFRWVDGVNIQARLPGAEAYCSLYIPDPSYPGSRISITGDELVIECPSPSRSTPDGKYLPRVRTPELTAEQIVELALSSLGLKGHSVEDIISIPQKYSKILPIDNKERQRFILWASENYNIYSFGRFATWRPGLLLDDLVKDIRVIHRLINGGTSYDHRK